MQDCKQRPGVYVPQLGDDVVYIQEQHMCYHCREGHPDYVANPDDQPPPPWINLKAYNPEVSSGCLIC